MDKNLSIEELEQMAVNGKLRGYTGSNFQQRDAFGLQYGSRHGNVLDNPEKSSIRYKLTLSNEDGGGNTRTAIIGGPKGTLGLIDDGAFADKADAAGLIGSGKTTSIAQLNHYLDTTDGLVGMMRLRTTNAAQYDEIFTLKQKSFDKNAQEEFIDPQDFQNEASYNEKIITIKRPFVLGQNNFMEIPVIDGVTLTITMWFAVVNNNTLGFIQKLQNSFGGR